MPDSPMLEDAKQQAHDKVGFLTGKFTVENAGIMKLLEEGRESTFDMSVSKKDGKSILSVPGPFGTAELETKPQLNKVSLEFDLKGNEAKLSASGSNDLYEKNANSDAPRKAATETVNLEASVPFEELLKSQTQGKVNFKFDDTLHDGDGNLVMSRSVNCEANVDSQAFDPIEATCAGKVTDADGKEYQIASKETLAGSSMTLLTPEGKAIGTVNTQVEPKDDETVYKVDVKPASDK